MRIIIIRDRAKNGKVPIEIVPFVIFQPIFCVFHTLSIYKKSFLFATLVGAPARS